MPLKPAQQRLQKELQAADNDDPGKNVLQLLTSMAAKAEPLQTIKKLAAEADYGNEGCTFYFYLGEQALLRKQSHRAEQFFRLQSERLPEECAASMEYLVARDELKRLQR